MARARKDGSSLAQLQAENERLRAENEQLHRQSARDIPAAPSSAIWVRTARRVGVGVFAVLAVLLIVVANLLFWTGNTIVKTDRFNEAVAPIIKNTTVQQGIASYTTNQLYSNVDVVGAVQNALPPRADFLAPTIATQLRNYTQTALQKVLANMRFQDAWNQLLSNSHARFINTIKQSGGSGTIDLNGLYQQLSGSLQNTKLSFLANKQLPPKVGDIQVASGAWIKPLHEVIVHIDVWRVLTVVLLILFIVLAVFLSRRRRRMVGLISIYSALGMFITLIAVRYTREVVAGKVNAQYADAARQATQILLHPLVIQTTLILVAFALVAIVAWISGSSRSARYIQGRIQLLFAGKLHAALFGKHENAVTIWVGRYKRYIEWTIVGVIALLMLFTRLTSSALLIYVVILIVAILLVELIGAPVQENKVPDA